MLASIFSLNVIQTALELGCIYALVAALTASEPPASINTVTADMVVERRKTLDPSSRPSTTAGVQHYTGAASTSTP